MGEDRVELMAAQIGAGGLPHLGRSWRWRVVLVATAVAGVVVAVAGVVVLAGALVALR